MTLLVRNEADIVDAQLAFHLNAGVDFVIATDNGSDDGTLEILQRYERSGQLHLLHERGDDMRQGEWVTHMARLAATQFGADWVINSDADEFWWPRGGSLAEVLQVVPARYGVVRGCWRHFVPRPAGDPFFAERMTVRLCRPAFPGDKETIYHAHQKVAHRGVPDAEIEDGNHNATGTGLEPLRAWHPLEVLHFSLRSPEQVARKAEGGWLRNPDHDPPAHQLLLDQAVVDGRLANHYDSLLVDDSELERGLGEGRYEIDTRLRDALRLIRTSDGQFETPRSGPPFAFPTPALPESAAFAAEASTLVEIDGIVRAEQRVDAVERRIERLESRRAGWPFATRTSLLALGRRLAPR